MRTQKLSVAKRDGQEIDRQNVLLGEAAAAAVQLLQASATLHYLDVVHDVLLQKGGLRPNLFRSSEDALSFCVNRAKTLVALRESSPIPLRVPEQNVELAKSFVDRVPDAVATEILATLHYLKSPRLDSVQLGLVVPGRNTQQILLGLASLSECDSSHVARLVGAQLSDVTVLSRLVILPGAPKNSASRLIAKTTGWVRKYMPQVRVLATYNNPNLGFTGAIYRAANWALAGEEKKRPDVLLDGIYVTLRELKRRFGTFEPTALKKSLGDRITILPPPWFALEIYAYRLRDEVPVHEYQ